MMIIYRWKLIVGCCWLVVYFVEKFSWLPPVPRFYSSNLFVKYTSTHTHTHRHIESMKKINENWTTNKQNDNQLITTTSYPGWSFQSLIIQWLRWWWSMMIKDNLYVVWRWWWWWYGKGRKIFIKKKMMMITHVLFCLIDEFNIFIAITIFIIIIINNINIIDDYQQQQQQNSKVVVVDNHHVVVVVRMVE